MSNRKKLLGKLLALGMAVGMIPASMLGAATASNSNDPYYGTEEDTGPVYGVVDDTTTPVITVPFADVPAGAYYLEALKWAIDEGITNGVSDTTFAPGQTCSEDQMITFLWRVAGSPRPANAVSGTDYYSEAVQWAREKGIIVGNYGGGDVCDRAEMVTFLWRAFQRPHRLFSHKFVDVDAAADYYPALLWALKEGITNGTSESTFSPHAACTRAQMVTFLYRAYQ